MTDDGSTGLIGDWPLWEGHGRTPGMHGHGRAYHLLVPTTSPLNKALAGEAGRGRGVSRAEPGYQHTLPTAVRDRAWYCWQSGHAGLMLGIAEVLIAALPSPSPSDVGPEAGTQYGSSTAGVSAGAVRKLS